MLLQLPFDAHSFLGEFEESWDSVIDGLARWCGEFRGRPAEFQVRYETVFGYLGLLLVTLVSLRHSYAYRYPRRALDADPGSPAAGGHDCQALCVPMLEEAPVRRALCTVYAPGAASGPEPLSVAPSAEASAAWQGIDPDSLRFHRHGTTSFILSGVPAGVIHGRRPRFALKCIVYPYLRVPTIIRATNDYAARYGVHGDGGRHLVRVWASCTSWIMMDFVPGESLAEHLRRRTADPAPRPDGGPPDPGRPRRRAARIRLDLLAELGVELFAALAELERTGLRHCDLSPSNIIVSPDEGGQPTFVLIDLGVNYLYSHAVPGLEGPDARYVAPEVRAGDGGTAHTDLYSVGQLLVAIAGVPNGPGDALPDAFYATTPVMARFIEDLTDSDPRNRLLIFRPEAGRPLQPQLRTFFTEELAAVTAAEVEQPARSLGSFLAGLPGIFTPLAGAPSRQRRMWRIRREQQLYRDPRRGMHVRWLLAWSWLSAAAWYLAVFIVANWWLRDLHWNWGNQPITAWQKLTGGTQDQFPVLDGIRQRSSPVPDAKGNLPVRMVGVSFLMAGARYYQNLFSGITPRVAGLHQGRLSVLAGCAEVTMRLFSVVPFVLVMPPTLIQRDWWPVFTAIGIACIFVSNMSSYLFAREVLQTAQEGGLTTVPAGRVTGLEAFGYWAPSAAFYCLIVTIISTFWYADMVHDTFVYAGAVTAINVVLFYMIKCSGESAANVRTALGRACLAAERLRYAAERG